MNIYIYIYIEIYIYRYSIDEDISFVQKDAHRFTDHFASPECLCVSNSRGKPSIYFLLDIGYVVYIVYVVANVHAFEKVYKVRVLLPA